MSRRRGVGEKRFGERVNAYDTHRCAGSLANHCSIRLYHVKRIPEIEVDGADWEMWMRRHSDEFPHTYMRFVGLIRYCPWCGEDL